MRSISVNALSFADVVPLQSKEERMPIVGLAPMQLLTDLTLDMYS